MSRLRTLWNKGKCAIGMHAGPWRFVDAGSCLQVQLCEHCDTESQRTEHQWATWQLEDRERCTWLRVCDRCSETEQKTEHDWAEPRYVHRHTCSQVSACTRCGEQHERVTFAHQWASWQFSDRYHGPVRVCARCGELAKPGASGTAPEEDEWRLILLAMLGADDIDQVATLVRVNESALFCDEGLRLIEREKLAASEPGLRRQLDNLEQLLLHCQEAGIDVALQRAAGGTPTASTPRRDAAVPDIDRRLVGTWKNTYAEGGDLFVANFIELQADGRFEQTRRTAYAGSVVGTAAEQMGSGRWSAENGVLMLDYGQGQPLACRYRWLHPNAVRLEVSGSVQDWERE